MPSNTSTPTFRKNKRVSKNTKRRNNMRGGGVDWLQRGDEEH